MADDARIERVLATLEAEDPQVADGARAALSWLTAGEGTEALTQERLQHFLWYGLPMKWLTDVEHHHLVAGALARAFDLLELPRYAELCRSTTTASILDAYERSPAAGKRAFRTADLASGIRPPDTATLRWSAVMGPDESAALSSTAELLELAVASGELVPGAKGWKPRQQALVEAHLTTARIELAGRTWADAVLDERIEWWLDGRRSPTRRRALEALVDVVRHPAGPPVGDDVLAPLRWLLGELADGQPLTQTGNLSRAFVQDAAGRFGWWRLSPHSLPRNEDDLYDLHQVRRLAQRLGLVRRSGRRLGLTRAGQALRDDPDGLARAVASVLVPEDDFSGVLGEVALALLLGPEPVPGDVLTEVGTDVVHEVGWREVETGEPPNDFDISRAWHATTNLLRALSLLAVGGAMGDRSYQLTVPGRAIALDALHHRATGPRSTPWG